MKCLIIIAFIFSGSTAKAQKGYNEALLDTLAQIASTNTTSRYFTKLYYEAIEATNKYAAKQPDSVRQFIFGFESYFGPAFFRSYRNFTTHAPQTDSWQFYYTDTSLNEMQYKFLGMNAHINGDMWLALKDKYCYDTLKKYKRPLIRFQKVLNIFFDSIYITTGKYKKLKHLHFYTLGLDKSIGRKIVLSWRKEQVELAMLYYSDQKKWKRKLRHSQKRLRRWNRFAVNWIK